MRVVACLIVVSCIQRISTLSLDAAEPSGKFNADVARAYAGVAGWQGFWESTVTRSLARANNSGHTEKTYESLSHGRFELSRSPRGWSPQDGDFTWTGSGEARGNASETLSTWSRWGPGMVGEDWQARESGAVRMGRVEFSLHLERQFGSLHPGMVVSGEVPKRREGHAVVALSGASGRHEYGENAISETTRGGVVPFYLGSDERAARKHWAVVQGGPGVLALAHEGRSRDVTAGDQIQRSRVILVPLYDDVEVEVTIAGYAAWRPRGSIADPSQPGNALLARATLKSKRGATPDLPEVEQFRFELLDTSREPGVCLNWPLGAKDEDYDLRFADLSSGSTTEQLAAVRKFFAEWGLTSGGEYDVANLPAGGIPRLGFAEVSEDGQRAELTEPPKDAVGQPFAEAAIESLDFGAKAELRVTCILRDGRELLGLMKGDDGEQDLVRLPKRAGPDWIAENWRKEKDVLNLAANDDHEKVTGQKHHGDGFTLYEEYRGWVQQGKHLEGDPKRKDFFVLNRIGADAQGGIALFERVSQLRVHSRLRANEIIDLPTIETESVANAKGERIMNWNHRDAPHRVDQHAVILINTSGFRSSGGGTQSVRNDDQTSRAFRPGKVQFVRVEERGRIDGVFSLGASTAAYNLSAPEAAFAYDRGVAHELLHAVGVDHHGEGEEVDELYFQSASDPNNPTRRARFVARMPWITEDDARRGDLGRGDTYTLIWEDTQRDVAEGLAAEFERALAAQRAQRAVEPPGMNVGEWATRYPALGKDAFYWQESELHDRTVLRDRARFVIRVTSCQPGGADSGNELCLMRYYFANAYPIEERARTFYLVRPGPNANRAGRDLCHSPDGTGHNAPSHQPQSRFGDASPGRGGCFQHICPNDAIPGRTL